MKYATPSIVLVSLPSSFQLLQARNTLAKQDDKAKLQDTKYREMPDIVIKVVCRYRAELFFKISRKTKLSRLFGAFTERMEDPGKKAEGNGVARVEAMKEAGSASKPNIQFIFTHNGRTIHEEQTPEDVGMEDQDEILAVELMDLTQNGEGVEEWVRQAKSSFFLSRNQSTKYQTSLIHRKSTWSLDGNNSRRIGMTTHKSRHNAFLLLCVTDFRRARKTLEDIFDGV